MVGDGGSGRLTADAAWEFEAARLGMIAGAGDIPLLIARQARSENRHLPTIALSPQIATVLSPYCPILTQHGPGQLSKIIRTLRNHDVRQVALVGKVDKRFLFQTPRLDLRALRRLGQLPDYRDLTMMAAVADEFAREGIQVVEQTRLLGHLLTPEGVVGRHRPNRRAWQDIGYGYAQAKQLASMDIGQTVVVRRRTILAVEALEGTDAAIRRGCAYGRGAVVVKVNRRRHDMRFDVPAVGPSTVEAVVEGRAAALALEAGATVMLNRPDLIAAANANRLSLVGITPTLLQPCGGEAP
ncbi:MAG: UDP-2,3-diacylglucosamine diphosphatase LpxI [Candidatus Tectomicrobia bacterium]|nr:UDP-2,3-diacylglucosamine diphosphatase LpxI [Candidatus Tectomicrobia bacterium]